MDTVYILFELFLFLFLVLILDLLREGFKNIYIGRGVVGRNLFFNKWALHTATWISVTTKSKKDSE